MPRRPVFPLVAVLLATGAVLAWPLTDPGGRTPVPVGAVLEATATARSTSVATATAASRSSIEPTPSASPTDRPAPASPTPSPDATVGPETGLAAGVASGAAAGPETPHRSIRPPAFAPGLGAERSGRAEPDAAPDPSTLTGYRWPVAQVRISNPFGPSWYGDTLVGGERFHDGVDLATFCGDHVMAAHAGVVLAAGRRFDPFIGWLGSLEPHARLMDREHRWGSLPIVVIVDDGNGYRSIYAHFNALAHDIRRGARVRAGQFLGWEGATGFASGCHLHYGLFSPYATGRMQLRPDVQRRTRYPKYQIDRIDPMRVLPRRAGASAKP